MILKGRVSARTSLRRSAVFVLAHSCGLGPDPLRRGFPLTSATGRGLRWRGKKLAHGGNLCPGVADQGGERLGNPSDLSFEAVVHGLSVRRDSRLGVSARSRARAMPSAVEGLVGS